MSADLILEMRQALEPFAQMHDILSAKGRWHITRADAEKCSPVFGPDAFRPARIAYDAARAVAERQGAG